MASVFKRTRTAVIPTDATFRKTRKDIPKTAKVKNGIATWTDRNGVLVGGEVSGNQVILCEVSWVDPNSGKAKKAKLTPDGCRIVTGIDPNYSAKYRNSRGNWVRKSTGTSDREDAKRIANTWESEAKLRAEGAVDERAEQMNARGNRYIAEVVNAHMAYLATKNGTEKYRKRVRKYIDEFIDFGAWKLLRDIESESVLKRAETLLAQGMAPRTVNARLTALKGFTRWLVPDHWFCDPLAGVKKPNPVTDRRLVRRMLLPAEWPHLRNATVDSSDLAGLSGETDFRYTCSPFRLDCASTKSLDSRAAKLFSTSTNHTSYAKRLARRIANQRSNTSTRSWRIVCTGCYEGNQKGNTFSSSRIKTQLPMYFVRTWQKHA